MWQLVIMNFEAVKDNIKVDYLNLVCNRILYLHQPDIKYKKIYIFHTSVFTEVYS